jgi:hypothetical protein
MPLDLPSRRFQCAHAGQKSSEKPVPTTPAWAIYGHAADCPSAWFRSRLGRRFRTARISKRSNLGRPGTLATSGPLWRPEALARTRLLEAAYCFIFPTVFQKTVKTAENGQ